MREKYDFSQTVKNPYKTDTAKKFDEEFDEGVSVMPHAVLNEANPPN